MSWDTQSWAAKQRPGSASAKLVLLGLASCADAEHCAYPSVKWLCDFGDLDRKTVIAVLDRLQADGCGLIRDTGERRGRTGQVKVYRLACDAICETVPKTEPFAPPKSPVFPIKESQKRDTEPYIEPIPPLSSCEDNTPKGLSGTRKAAPVVTLPDGIDPETWDAFVAMRTRIRKPMTARAAELMLRRLMRFADAGHDPNAILETSIRNCWSDCYAPKPERDGGYRGRPETIAESIGRRQMAVMGGPRHGIG